jgi:leucyl aminopeptidase
VERADVCNPEYVAKQTELLAEQFPNSLKVKILERDELEKLGMNMMLAVGKGSRFNFNFKKVPEFLVFAKQLKRNTTDEGIFFFGNF